MSTYTELKGLKVKYLDSDPSPGTSGDVWYNSGTTGALKAFVGRSAWSAGSLLNTSRFYLAGFGIQTAAIIATGNTTNNNYETKNHGRIKVLAIPLEILRK